MPAAGTLLLMTRDFTPVSEVPIRVDSHGEGATAQTAGGIGGWRVLRRPWSPPRRPRCLVAVPVSVGWGRKETQFHGRAGKAAALASPTALPPGAAALSPDDDGLPRVAWRADGAFFVCSSIDEGDSGPVTRGERRRLTGTRLTRVRTRSWTRPTTPQHAACCECTTGTRCCSPPRRWCRTWSTCSPGGTKAR